MRHEAYIILVILLEKKKRERDCNATNTKLGTRPEKEPVQELRFISFTVNLPLVSRETHLIHYAIL